MHESAIIAKAQNKILSDYSDRFCYESEFKKDLKKIPSIFSIVCYEDVAKSIKIYKPFYT